LSASPYRQPLRKLRQGDIALCEFHQLRARSGEGRGPGDSAVANEDIPYFGAPQDFEVQIQVPRTDRVSTRILRVWIGSVVVVSQSCELEYADEQDARVLVAPLVSSGVWTNGPWELIRRGSLPGFLHLPGATAAEVADFGLDADWPESAVALGSTTLVSRGIVAPNRMMSLSPAMTMALQESLVRFTSVRGWGDVPAAEGLRGKQIVDVRETVEMVPGPARLTKVVLDGPDGSGADEITVVCGLRPGRRAA
jgi:hypothetical protein